MIRRPPRSTLFPYTRSSDLAPCRRRPADHRPSRQSSACPASTTGTRSGSRSEEHTSELQSRLHLVCRLLLEKKKNTLHAPDTPLLMVVPQLPSEPYGSVKLA